MAATRVAKVHGIRGDVRKASIADSRGAEAEQTKYTPDQLIEPPYPLAELRKLTELSTILRQCITAYRRNITGFGVGLQYTEDLTGKEETPEMKREWDMVKAILKNLHFDKSPEELFAQVIEHREECGNAYLEIIRDGRGLPVGANNIEPEYIKMTPLGSPVDVEYVQNGIKLTRKARFRKFCQQIGTSTVWFKEFGDPRRMDCTTGQYIPDGAVISEDRLATELLHFKIGNKAYGVPRWIGQVIHMYGARKAEELNYRYFYQGRHIPMAIILTNAEMSPESIAQLEDYASSIEGVEKAHKFLVIETTAKDVDDLLMDQKPKASVEIKPLAELLQKDALFLEYDEASRKKVQSAFGLPDIYIGRSTDFNRATAETARLITEEQVFEPERNNIEWIVNNKLLRPYELKYVVMSFKKPDISNTEDLTNVIRTFIEGHAVTPNDLRELAGTMLGKDLEPFDIPEADMPIGLNEQQSNPLDSFSILKSKDVNVNLVDLLKDIRDALEEVSAHAGRAKSS